MGDFGVRPQALRSRFLQIHSSHDIHSDSKSHNPADFEISMPNSTISTGVVRIVPHTVSIPRVFYNVYAPSNAINVWRRKTKVVSVGVNEWLVTAEPEWSKTTLSIPPGIYTYYNLVETMANNGWFDVGLQFSVEDRRLTVVNQSMGGYWEWGYVSQPESPPVPPEYMPQTFITEPEGSHFFDVLGLAGAQFVTEGDNWLSPVFDETRPETADCIRGSEIEAAKIIVAAFATDAHAMDGLHISTPFIIRNTNPLNLEGPVSASVVIEGLGDNATVDAESGKPADVITEVPLATGSTPMYTYATRLIQDCDAEAIQYASERSLRGFRVRLQDANGTTLRLPRNWPVHIRLQILQTQ